MAVVGVSDSVKFRVCCNVEGVIRCRIHTAGAAKVRVSVFKFRSKCVLKCYGYGVSAQSETCVQHDGVVFR